MEGLIGDTDGLDEGSIDGEEDGNIFCSGVEFCGGSDGWRVGAEEGWLVGFNVAGTVGLGLKIDGLDEGRIDGEEDGNVLCSGVEFCGGSDGWRVGAEEGWLVGFNVAGTDGLDEGRIDGEEDGNVLCSGVEFCGGSDGWRVGAEEGWLVGFNVGLAVGKLLGDEEGLGPSHK